MTITESLLAIDARMQDLVEFSTTVDLEDRVEYDNVPFELPKPKATPRVRWTVLPGESDRLEMGPDLTTKRITGIAIAQVFTAVDEGKKESKAIVDLLLSVFDPRETIDGVSYKTPYETRIGRSDGEFQVNVTCPFTIDEVN